MEQKNSHNGGGLSLEEIAKLGEGSILFYKQFGQHFHNKLRDTSEYGLKYIAGLLRMETDRSLVYVGGIIGISGQNRQHFVSTYT